MGGRSGESLVSCCGQCRGIEAVFDDSAARRDLRRYRRKGATGSTRQLIDAIAAEGVAGLTFLDIGGGIGQVQHELMACGARGGTSVDASPAYLQTARDEAVRRGYGDRMRYLGGDFVTRANDVEAAEIVTLDRVICCYPDMPALLGAAAPLARRTLGIVFPRNTPFIRAGVAIVNFVQRLRRHPFRGYIHDPDEVEAVLARHGLRRRSLREGFLWRVMVYGRNRQSPAA